MKKKYPILQLGLLAMLFLLVRTVNALQTTTLLITEVYYDTPGADEEEEWIELVYLGAEPLALTGYKLGDEENKGQREGMMGFPDGALVEPNQVIIVAQTAAGFRKLYGIAPDYEMLDTEADVPDMILYAAWAGGTVGLSNGGDEVLLLDALDNVVDAINYGDSVHYFSPAIGGVLRGQSIERVPASCDTDSPGDWQPQRTTTPGVVSFDSECAAVVLPAAPLAAAVSNDLPPIGQIQGVRDVAAQVNQEVTFRGVVTGMYEDRNVEGTTYYTLFVQDLPGSEDGDPQTSDAIAVFAGVRRPQVVMGDLVRVTGQVTEFFGYSEIDDTGLQIEVESRGNPLPAPVAIMPPADTAAAAAYFEPLESMRVMIEGAAPVLGPTFSGCAFAVAPPDAGISRVIRQRESDPIGQIIPILHTTDITCAGFPDVKVGDQVEGIVGPLIYNFDQFKIVQQQTNELRVTVADMPPLPEPLQPAPGQFTITTFNVENYFDLIDDTRTDAEPKPSPAELSIKQAKLSYALSRVLGCPTIVGIIEVEKASLLQELADQTASACGFTYAVHHMESPDARGIDVALLTQPDRVAVQSLTLRQGCSTIRTESDDGSINCPAGQFPLFSRPPLQASLTVDGEPLLVLVNHFKSKRGGDLETAPERAAQAQHLNELVTEILAADADAKIIVMGDFNDYNQAPPILSLTTGGGQLVDAMQRIPESERYSFVFSGASQLIDGMFVSPALADDIAGIKLMHVNADYPDVFGLDTSPEGIPYKSSDHDLPLLLVQWGDSAASASAASQLSGAAAAQTTSQADAPNMGVIMGLVGGAILVVLVLVAGLVWLRRR